ncbi:unnamed protein product [Trichogramma brassicae]|uniref:Uncharacterized protein n=1 Tax=Trichogramma brassicae TaxID=86971 RepID=A0A6H5IDQ9_9HYME|nr:unnamed protein product [Trichogramma brassicae]
MSKSERAKVYQEEDEKFFPIESTQRATPVHTYFGAHIAHEASSVVPLLYTLSLAKGPTGDAILFLDSFLSYIRFGESFPSLSRIERSAGSSRVHGDPVARSRAMPLLCICVAARRVAAVWRLGRGGGGDGEKPILYTLRAHGSNSGSGGGSSSSISRPRPQESRVSSRPRARYTHISSSVL